MKLIPRLHTLLLCFLIAATFSCAHKDTASGDNTAATTDAALNEITGQIEAGEWETARVKAENTYASARDGMTPLQAAKLAVIYISLTSEPGINFEQFYGYALRIVDLHDFALANGKSTVSNYFKIIGGETMVQEAYDNCRYIISVKQKIGADSTITFN